MAPVVVADKVIVLSIEVLRASAKSCLANIPCTGALVHLSIRHTNISTLVSDIQILAP